MGDATATHIRQTIERVLRHDPRLELVYLFGSVSQGEAGPGSDVDVAIGFSEPHDPLDRLRLLGEVEDALREVLGKAVDVVDLYRAPPVLVHQVLASGRPPALVRDEAQRLQFEAMARKVYFEMKRRYAVYDREASR
jgi:uncharacterized protein